MAPGTTEGQRAMDGREKVGCVPAKRHSRPILGTNGSLSPPTRPFCIITMLPVSGQQTAEESAE